MFQAGPSEQELNLPEEELSAWWGWGQKKQKTKPNRCTSFASRMKWGGIEDTLVSGWPSTALRKYDLGLAVWALKNIW